MFVFLFEISMDYEVFVLACLREEYDRTGDAMFGDWNWWMPIRLARLLHVPAVIPAAGQGPGHR
jgi:uncharacterized membrane protein YdfJ with MMPL/SSD domain